MRVLIVDDSPDDRALAARVLRRNLQAVEVAEAGEPEQLAQAFATGAPDAVITDFRLGWTDGLEVLDQVKQRWPGVPVVMFTNSGDEEVCARGMKRGLSDYLLKKPEYYTRLPIAVRSAIEFEQARASLAAAEAALRERAAELERANRRKDEFVTMLAHELRNPLAPMRNAVHLLGARPDDAATVQKAHATLQRQLQHIARLVDDLLDTSRITQGRIELRIERVDLARLVREAVEDRRALFEASNIALGMNASPHPICVLGDPARLAQVVGNLMDNALKFTPSGRVEVSVSRTDGEAVLRVADTGIGFDPEVSAGLFEVFAQAEQPIDRPRGGLGIGLALVRELARLHGGRVRGHSAGPGAGAEFEVRLPPAPEVPAVEDNARSPSRRPAKSRRVLVIEDNRDAADTLEMLLQAAGHEVAVAYTGTDGYQEALSRKPEVVVSDIGLPGMDGYEVARALRSEGLSDARLIAVTGYGQEESLRLAMDAGFDTYMVKPVDPERLLREIEA